MPCTVQLNLFKLVPHCLGKFVCPDETYNLFLGSLVSKFYDAILAFILRKMRGGEDRDSVIFKRSSDRVKLGHLPANLGTFRITKMCHICETSAASLHRVTE